MKNFILASILLSGCFLLSCQSADQKRSTVEVDENGVAILTDSQIEEIVKRSYAYVTLYSLTNKGAIRLGGWGTMETDTQPKDHTLRVIARPNNDTYYITCAVDLWSEPVILDMPAFDSDYASLMITGYDHYVTIPMSTRQGDFRKPQKMLVFSERSGGYTKGEQIEGIDRYYEATGDFVSAILRVVPHSADPERSARIVAQMKNVTMMPLSQYRGDTASTVRETNPPALGKTDFDIFENNLLEVMQYVFNHTTFDPENEMDQRLLAVYAPLGVVPGQAMDEEHKIKLDGKRFRQTAERISAEELTKTDDLAADIGLFQPKGQISLDLMLFQTIFGPIGQPAQEAVYPAIQTADGTPMNANHDYVIHMSKDAMPPATAFWSFTLYDTENGFFLPNDRKKYNVGKNAGMQLNEDGSIDVYIAAEQPKGVPDVNWLPLHRGDFGIDVVLRIYVPDLDAYKSWTPPVAEILK